MKPKFYASAILELKSLWQLRHCATSSPEITDLLHFEINVNHYLCILVNVSLMK